VLSVMIICVPNIRVMSVIGTLGLYYTIESTVIAILLFRSGQAQTGKLWGHRGFIITLKIKNEQLFYLDYNYFENNLIWKKKKKNVHR